jgi:hypothetical protein
LASLLLLLRRPVRRLQSLRQFSLLAVMFGDNQRSALTDLLQGSLMLRYNQRPVG